MKPEIKKNIFGRVEIKFDCPKCAARLTSPLLEAGEVDQCPTCATKFRVPGKQQREAYEAQLAKDSAEKEAEKALRAEERRIAAEEKRLQQEERRLEQEEEQRRRKLIVARDEEDRRRRELANLLPPATRGQIIDPKQSFGITADLAQCPFCAELVSLQARKCKHCGELLDPVLRAAEENRRLAATPQIVNIVHGGNASASASTDVSASASSSSSLSEMSGCSGCLTLIILGILISGCIGALSR